jgi:hypothetical protein
MPHVTKSISLSWDVAKKVTKAISASWDTHKRISKAVSIVWNINGHISKSYSLLWAVLTHDSVDGCGTDAPCPADFPAVDQAFSRIYVSHVITGDTRVFWELNRHLKDTGVYVFQLQTSESGIDTGVWENVGGPITNSVYAVDAARRLYGKQLYTTYRIKLTTDQGVYYSNPISAGGTLAKRDFLLAREITRKELLRLNKFTAIAGYLLIRKRSGEVCSCIDALTGEITNSQHLTCFGTGFVGGYYAPVECTFFDTSPDSRKELRDMAGRGMVDDTMKMCRFVGYPAVRTYDIFVEKDSDERYSVASIKGAAEIRGVPIVVQPVIKLVPYSDVIYKYDIPR